MAAGTLGPNTCAVRANTGGLFNSLVWVSMYWSPVTWLEVGSTSLLFMKSWLIPITSRMTSDL